ncbi:TatD family hydrolase [Janibacter sp. G349]|jgi:TatD DNase family protein|uniref:TatD family hydrolase n=1 Tax=unclassified Janibacter TaxID=2649294 RepID=UPI0020CC5FD8|nr:TatD family hydrolase [Janibacter sp. CX7]UTT65512.1 TatD family hydrolase [Janibacter sp. CX7]
MADREGVAPHPDPLPVAVVDNHTHLDIRRRDVADAIAPEGGEQRSTDDVAAALASAASVGVDRVVQVGCDLESARFTVDQVDRHPSMLGAVALHPNEIPALAEAGELQSAWDEIERLAAHPRVRAIGESGLDYFRTGPEGHAVQQESFRWHIDLAKRTGKALQIHDRDSHDDVLRILAEEGAPETTVLHCFSGDLAMARECVERGYLLSFAGTLTFKSAGGLREALAHTPIEQVLAETDAPYLTPTPERGRANAPYLLPHTVRVMARTLGVDVPTMCAAISANSERVYGPWA